MDSKLIQDLAKALKASYELNKWAMECFGFDADLREFEDVLAQVEPTCTKPELHAMYSDRGIEDQCPYCPFNTSRTD